MTHPTHRCVPRPAHVESVAVECEDTRTFVLRLDVPHAAFDAARPGQFVMVSVLGVGEAAFTLSQLPRAGASHGTVVVTVRRVGRVTSALFALTPGARVGVRGPLGHGFPDTTPNLPTLYVAGGCGLAPLKAAIDVQLADCRAATPIAITYGARDPASRIHRAALDVWGRTAGVVVDECVEHHESAWTGRVGTVLDQLGPLRAQIQAERAMVCGPAAMMDLAIRRLQRAGLAADAIFCAVERHMQCGTGECGHCYINHRYVCTDGPVFSAAALATLPDAFAASRRLEVGVST